MKRSDFFKSMVGLIGVVGSINELSLINTPIIEQLPYNTRAGDILISKDYKTFLFDGKFIRSISDGKHIPKLAKASNMPSTYIRVSNACAER